MDQNIDFISLVGIFSTGVGIFLGVFFLLRTKFKDDRYLFLYLLMFFLSYELFYKTLIHSHLIYNYLFLYRPGRFFNLLIYPVFLLFIWSITKQTIKLKPIHWLILILLIGYELFQVGQSFNIDYNQKKTMLDLFYEDKRPGPFNYWSNPATFVKSTLIPFLFFSLIGYDFFRFKKNDTNIKSNRLVNLLSFVIIIYFSINVLSNYIYKIGYVLIQYSMIEWPVDIIFLSLIVSLFAVLALVVNTGSSFFPSVKYASSALKKDAYETIINKTRALIEEKALYLETDLTIVGLANLLDTNSKYLSQAINHHLEISFVDFINTYRIEYAKEQLLNKRNERLTIEAIGNLAGFKSKSAFFRAFKKITNSTPNQYIKQQSSSDS